jgi:uncharacterized membrane protein
MNSSSPLIYLPWIIFFIGIGGTVLLGYRSINRQRKKKLNEHIDRMEHLLEEAENSSSLPDETRQRIKEVLRQHP